MGYSAVSIGLVKDGEPELGVVYNPFTCELYSARRNNGARLNGNPIHVSERSLKHAFVTFGATSYHKDITDRMFRTLRGLFDHCEDLRQFGAASLDICRVAAGRLDAFMELRLYPWDYTAGMCILLESGGRITTTEGEPLLFDSETSVLAANSACYEEALSICLNER
jgi:myo-inositol-1(or 4)-monophosphatase